MHAVLLIGLSGVSNVWALDPTPNSPPPQVIKSSVYFEPCRVDPSAPFGFRFEPSSPNAQQIMPGTLVSAYFPREDFDPAGASISLLQGSSNPQIIFQLVPSSDLQHSDPKEWIYDFIAPGVVEVRRHHDLSYFAHLSIVESMGTRDYCALVRFEVTSTETNPTVSVGNGADALTLRDNQSQAADDGDPVGCGIIAATPKNSMGSLNIAFIILTGVISLSTLRRRSRLYERK